MSTATGGYPRIIEYPMIFGVYYFDRDGRPCVCSMGTEQDAQSMREVLRSFGVDTADANDPRIWNLFPIKPTEQP